MGHVHLKVSSTAETISFYRDVLGFGLMAQRGSQAAFLSAGGYHQHIGANTWESAGASAATLSTVRLRHATIVLPDDTARRLVLDRVIRSGQEPRSTAGGRWSRIRLATCSSWLLPAELLQSLAGTSTSEHRRLDGIR
ncbi:MAG TPA: VOC family protein, partial [Solirubrobacteraceae bacterium]